MSERVDSERLRALAEAATPGPWAAEARGWNDGSEAIRLGEHDWDGYAHHLAENAAYIAACSPDVLLTLLTENERYREALRRIMSELGVPSEDYPAPVANAYEIARDALAAAASPPKEDAAK